MKYEQIWKKFFPPKKHTYAKESIISKVVYFLVFIFFTFIIIIIGLVKYSVWFMPFKLFMRVDKQSYIDHLVS